MEKEAHLLPSKQKSRPGEGGFFARLFVRTNAKPFASPLVPAVEKTGLQIRLVFPVAAIYCMLPFILTNAHQQIFGRLQRHRQFNDYI
ncbi:MAG: hypothetical protein HDT27_00820 [Subdoligranulum sp.]|nr:hypothetical protein [Subdoligranulum sp.]